MFQFEARRFSLNRVPHLKRQKFQNRQLKSRGQRFPIKNLNPTRKKFLIPETRTEQKG